MSRTKIEIQEKLEELRVEAIPPNGVFRLRRRARYWIQALEWVLGGNKE